MFANVSDLLLRKNEHINVFMDSCSLFSVYYIQLHHIQLLYLTKMRRIDHWLAL